MSIFPDSDADDAAEPGEREEEGGSMKFHEDSIAKKHQPPIWAVGSIFKTREILRVCVRIANHVRRCFCSEENNRPRQENNDQTNNGRRDYLLCALNFFFTAT